MVCTLPFQIMVKDKANNKGALGLMLLVID